MGDVFTTHGAARILGVHPFTVGRYIDQGALKAFRTAGGHRRVAAADLRRYLLEHAMPVPRELASAGEKVRLLVVDDEQPVLNAIRRGFKPFASDVELTLTTSGIEALLLLGDLRPDALLIDLNLPGLDGFEVCRQVRSIKSLVDVKLVAMTSLHRSDIIGSALTAGAIACLEKPVDAGEVLALLSPPRARGRASEGQACAIIGCSQPPRSLGYCTAHYQKRRYLERKLRLPTGWVENPHPGSVTDLALPRGRSAVRALAVSGTRCSGAAGPRRN